MSRPPDGVVGPNAIIRQIAALADFEEDATVAAVLAIAGLPYQADQLPLTPVPEAEAATLTCALRASLGPLRAHRIAWEGGQQTAAYLLTHRIPPWLRRLLAHLPRHVALGVLLRAIRRNAWTFGAHGRLTLRPGPVPAMEIANCPHCRGLRADEPACGFVAGTLEGLVKALVDPRLHVRETDCAAVVAGAACRFTFLYS